METSLVKCIPIYIQAQNRMVSAITNETHFIDCSAQSSIHATSGLQQIYGMLESLQTQRGPETTNVYFPERPIRQGPC